MAMFNNYVGLPEGSIPSDCIFYPTTLRLRWLHISRCLASSSRNSGFRGMPFLSGASLLFSSETDMKEHGVFIGILNGDITNLIYIYIRVHIYIYLDMIYGCVGELVIYHYEIISMGKTMIIHRILVYITYFQSNPDPIIGKKNKSRSLWDIWVWVKMIITPK